MIHKFLIITLGFVAMSYGIILLESDQTIDVAYIHAYTLEVPKVTAAVMDGKVVVEWTPSEQALNLSNSVRNQRIGYLVFKHRDAEGLLQLTPMAICLDCQSPETCRFVDAATRPGNFYYFVRAVSESKDSNTVALTVR